METKIEYNLSSAADLTPLLDAIGNARVVMLGEASHGTHEYYTWRTALSKRLIEEKGFTFIAVEGDWPDCYRLNRYVKGYPESGSNAREVLHAFRRWPTWMWANWEIVALAEWLKTYNTGKSTEKRAGFYGLDVYSLWESLETMRDYLEKEDPKTAGEVVKVLKCFEPYGEDVQAYAHYARFSETCEDKVAQLLKEIKTKSRYYDHDMEAALNTEQNAVIVSHAEKYYRTMMRPGNASWNLRDTHMMETLERLMSFQGKKAKAIVWEHNTHIGDARATDMIKDGTINIGQLARERYGKENVYLVGFGSYQGRVIASSGWDEPMMEMVVPAARHGSIEEILHREKPANRFLLFDGTEQGFDSPLLHRAIGVVYNPEYERHTNYVPSYLAERYNAFMYLDQTTALHPLHIHPDGHQAPETFPFGV